MINDYWYRTIVFQVPVTFLNALNVITNGIAAFYLKSLWLLTITMFYLLLTIMRTGAIHRAIIIEREQDIERQKRLEITIYRRNSYIYMILGIVFTGITVFLSRNDVTIDYPGFMIYGIAAYAFFMLAMSIVGIVKANKYRSPLLIIVRKLNNINACVSILTLQVALNTRFYKGIYEEFPMQINMFLSAIIALLIFGYGIQGIVESRRMLKNIM